MLPQSRNGGRECGDILTHAGEYGVRINTNPACHTQKFCTVDIREYQ